MDFTKLPPTGWIWTSEAHPDDGTPEVVYFRRVLHLQEKPASAPVRLSADSRYRFYVNGVSVAFGPCKGDSQVWYYDEADIAPHLQAGENVLAAVVLRYSLGQVQNHSVWRTRTPGFYLEGALEYSDGTRETLVADALWQCRRAPEVQLVAETPYVNYLWNTERTAGNPACKGWLLPGFGAAGWQAARPYSFFEAQRNTVPFDLSPRPIPPVYERPARFAKVERVREGALPADRWQGWLRGGAPLQLAANSEHIVELDVGELTCAFLELHLQGGAGAEIELLTSECYAYPPGPRDGMSMPNPIKGDRTDSENGQLYGVTDLYTVGGHGDAAQPEVYEPFWFRTLRYLRLHIKTGAQPLVLQDISLRETGYPLQVQTQIQAPWEDLAPIWDISLRTLRRCMHETYMDCPFYEQLQYAMDSRSQMLFTYTTAADDRLARRCIDDFHRALRADGLTNCCWPTMKNNIIPGFSLYYIMMIYDHMMYFGDKALVRRYLPTADAILEYFERRRDERGLVGQTGGMIMGRFWSFIDWVPQWTGGVPNAYQHGPLTMESLLYAATLDMAAQLADYAGRPAQGEEYRARAAAVKQAVNAHCLGENGLYQDGPGVEEYSQHCQVWAVLADAAPTENQRALMERTLADESLPKCSVSMAFYLFRAVEKAGLYAQTLPLWEPWRQMLRDHLTTCVENDTDARSDCHAWGSIILYELPAVVLGVRPAKPGCEAIEVKPNPAWLDSAEGTVITPRGPVRVAWSKTADILQLDVDAPEGVEVIRHP